MPRAADAGLFRKVLLGLSCRDDAACAEAVPAAFVRAELRCLNASAVKSLDEGFEETLTLHRLGVFGALGVSLKTTNGLESILALVGRRTAKVTRWRTSDQKQRWLAAALLDIAPRLRRVTGFRALPVLRAALQGAIRQQDTTAGTRVA